IVNIEAAEGKISAIGTVIESKSDGAGIINLAAQDDINISATEITSQGSLGISIHSAEGSINAENAEIISINGSANATVEISSEGPINLDGATVESRSSSNPPTPALLIESTGMGISARNAHFTSTSPGKLLEIRGQDFLDLDQAAISSQGAIKISSAANITARSASMISAADAKDLLITSTNGTITLSSLEVDDIPPTVMSSKGNIIITALDNIEAKSVNMTNSGWNNQIIITSSSGQVDLSSYTVDGLPTTNIAGGDNVHIKAYEDIYIEAAKISASMGWGKELRFESTGLNRRLWAQDANLTGWSIKAFNLEIMGTTANGNITIVQ
ncbi:MAG: hypothetical protein WC147_02345, partial [Syntrophomonas sp.]